MTVNQAARLLEVAPSTVYELCRSGQLGHYRVGRLVRIEPQDIDQFKQQARCPARPAAAGLRHIQQRPAASHASHASGRKTD